MRTSYALCLLGAFVALLGAYVALTLAGHDASGLFPAVVSLLAAGGVSAHVEKRTRAQDAVIEKIDRQTNGVLDGRIRDGATAAVEDVLTRLGHTIPPKA